MAPVCLAPGLLFRWDQVHLAGLGGQTGYLLTGYNGGDQQGLLINALGAVGSGLTLLVLTAVAAWLMQPGLWPIIRRFLHSTVRPMQTAPQARSDPVASVQHTTASEPSPSQANKPAINQRAKAAGGTQQLRLPAQHSRL